MKQEEAEKHAETVRKTHAHLVVHVEQSTEGTQKANSYVLVLRYPQEHLEQRIGQAENLASILQAWNVLHCG